MRKVVVVVNDAGVIIATAGITEVRSSEGEPHENRLEKLFLASQSTPLICLTSTFAANQRLKSTIGCHDGVTVFDPEPRLMERYQV